MGYHHQVVTLAAQTTLPQPGLQRRWTALPGEALSGGGDPYMAYDRFSRTEQALWLKDTGTGFDPRVHVLWGYNALPRQRHCCNGLRRRRPDTAWPERIEGNRNSLRTWRKDLLAPASTAQDQAFLYDRLQQIVNRQRGVFHPHDRIRTGLPPFGYPKSPTYLEPHPSRPSMPSFFE